MSEKHTPGEVNLFVEMKQWLDKQKITPENIGNIRRALFVPWDSKWNEWVRDETAKRERSLIDQFHNHLEQCRQCESSPFNLCPVGIELITAMMAAERALQPT